MARELDREVGPAGAGPETADAADALVHDPELEALQRKHRGFVFPAAVVTLVWYMALIFAAAYAHDFMATRVAGSFTVGYLFALSEFVLTFVLAWLYTRFAQRTFDPMAADLLAKLHKAKGDERSRP
jgi:uncharacterized membrane protein (DUF485 family)